MERGFGSSIALDGRKESDGNLVIVSMVKTVASEP